jgi:hypothetical protein
MCGSVDRRLHVPILSILLNQPTSSGRLDQSHCSCGPSPSPYRGGIRAIPFLRRCNALPYVVGVSSDSMTSVPGSFASSGGAQGGWMKRFVIITAAILYAVVDYVAAFTFLLGAYVIRRSSVALAALRR